MRIAQSVSKLVVFRAYLASDGKTPATGKTIAITISKNGATSFSNPNAGATNATEMASGFYKFTLDTTDTNTAGPLAWRGTHADINDAGDVYSVDVALAVESSVQAARDRLSTVATKTATVLADGGNSATQILTDLSEAASSHWVGSYCKITSGTLLNQVKKVTGYNGAGTLTFTSGFTGTPANGVTIELVND